MFGSGKKPYLREGQFQLNLSTRILTSDRHYNLDEQQFDRELLGNKVTNRQRQYEIGGTYAFTDEFNLSLSVPYIDSSWLINTRPGFFTGNTVTPSTDVIDLTGVGIGDISLIARTWLGDTDEWVDENVAFGLGLKFPTGSNDDSVIETDFAGNNLRQRFSDISVQPGTGGYGIIFDALAFKRIEETTFTLAASYLAEPKNTNNTPSIIDSLGIAPTAATALTLVNSAPDSYFAKFAAIHPVPGIDGLSATLGYRLEGSPRFDLIGRQDGFRRPGRATFYEPGLIYAKDRHTFSLSVPITMHRFRDLNSSPSPVTGIYGRGDATFPDYIVLANYSYRFGDEPAAEPAPESAAEAAPGTMVCGSCGHVNHVPQQTPNTVTAPPPAAAGAGRF